MSSSQLVVRTRLLCPSSYGSTLGSVRCLNILSRLLTTKLVNSKPHQMKRRYLLVMFLSPEQKAKSLWVRELTNTSVVKTKTFRVQWTFGSLIEGLGNLTSGRPQITERDLRRQRRDGSSDKEYLRSHTSLLSVLSTTLVDVLSFRDPPINESSTSLQLLAPTWDVGMQHRSSLIYLWPIRRQESLKRGWVTTSPSVHEGKGTYSGHKKTEVQGDGDLEGWAEQMVSFRMK